MGWVTVLVFFQLSRRICYHSPILHQYTTKSLTGCITIDHEIFADIWQCQHRSGGKLPFQFLEALFTLGRPFKLLGLLQKVGHRTGYLGENFDESTIISSQSKKLLTSVTLWGCSHSFTASILAGSTTTPSADSTWPRKATFYSQNSHLLNFA